MTTFEPLWAGVEDWIGIIVFILFIVIPAIGQIISSMSKDKPAKRVGGNRPQQPRGARVEMEDEIGAFLREAAQRKGEQGPAVRGQQPGVRKPQQPPQRPRRSQVEAVEAVIVEEPAVGGRVEREVQQHLDPSKFAKSSAELGGRVSQADQEVEQHLRQKFSGDVSRLQRQRGETAEAPTPVVKVSELEDAVDGMPKTAAAGLAALFANAQNIRQAIVINEILQRPEDRWS